MSVRALSWALHEAPVTNKADLLVLIALCDHAHDDGDGAYPSISRIAKIARLSTRGTHKALRSLEAANLIRGTRRPGRPTVYRVALTPASGAGVQTVQGCTADTGVCTSRPKPLHAVHPNRKEPSLTGEGAQARTTDFSEYDKAVIG